MAKTFSDKLQELREDKGLSQRALGRLCGLSGQAISLLESGQRVPAWNTVQLLAKALGVRFEAFVDDELELPPEQPPGKPGRPRKPAVEEQPADQEPPAGKRRKRK